MHQAMAATVEHCVREIREASAGMPSDRRRQPTPLAHDCASLSERMGRAAGSGGHRLEGFWRAHQVPLTEVKKNPEQLRILEKWMRDQKPEELFDANGRLTGTERSCADGDPPNERQSACQRRSPQEGAAPA